MTRIHLTSHSEMTSVLRKVLLEFQIHMTLSLVYCVTEQGGAVSLGLVKPWSDTMALKYGGG